MRLQPTRELMLFFVIAVALSACAKKAAQPAAPAEAPLSARGQARADSIMERWRVENPGVDWEAEERKSRTFVPAADNRHLLASDTQAPGHTYRNVTERDLLEWKRETEKLVVAGSKIFHSADELGSTVGVSCDMCHPNAANTHPETYPKFQTQMGRVALLRDMINWCLEQPVRAKPMDAGDPRMRALEAYIIGQRAGTPLEYGKH
jgi:thiosulfate dehydrogenase